ncbi:translocase subunit seca, partial [Brachionus plicatilis]
MTGTLGASQERDLLSNAYGLDFFHLPRFKRELNVRHEDFVFATRSAWLGQIKQSVDSYLANNRIIEKKEIDDSKKILQCVLDKKAILDQDIEYLKIKLDEAKLAEIGDGQSSQREKGGKCQGLETELNNLLKLKDDHDLCIENLRDLLGEGMSRNSGGRAVLIICKNKKDVNDVVRNLLVNHKHLFDFNGKLDGLRKVEGLSKRVPTEIRQLRPGDVVVATNVAGRGTDFKLSDLLLKNGGLHVILSYVPDNERVELQAFGRSGRKGQPGSGNLIVYDKRLFSNHELTVDLLKQERDADEEERLMEIRTKMIPRVIIEKDLFEKFEMLQDRVKVEMLQDSHKEYMDTNLTDSKYNELMIKSLHNKWAFWLEKMSSLINNVYKSNENKEEIFNCFDNFAAQIVKECSRDKSGIQGLIDEPSELIKLAKYNILSEKYDQAIKNCDAIIDNNCIEMCAFAYLYKAIALFRPVKNMGIELVDQNVQNIKGGFKIISEKIKKDGIHLLKMSIELFQKEIQRIQMRSQVLCKIGQENIKYGVGSKADHFSKSNANEISGLQIHLNAAQCVLKAPIDCQKLSNCLNSTKFFNRLSDDDEKKACEIKKSLLEDIIDDCQSNKLIKKARFSKKCILKCHINFKNREKMVADIIGEQLVHKAEKTPECFVLNQIDSCLEQKLKSNFVDFSREIYIRDLIDPSGFRHVKLPSQFFYLKERLLKQLENIHGKTTNERENVVTNLSKECLSLEKVFDIINQKFCLQNVKCVLWLQEVDKCSTNENVWQNDVFGDSANSIRNVLPKLFESNQCVEYSNLVNLIKEKLMEDKTQNQKQITDLDVVKITNHLFEKNILVLEEKFKFPNKIQQLIKEFKNSLCFKQDTNFYNIKQLIECIELSDFTKLSEKKEEIIDFFEKKLGNTQKNISREEFEEAIFGQNSDEYSYGFLKILLTLKKVLSSLDEWLKIDLTSSNLDENEIIEMNNIVLDLANLEFFTKQNLNLIPLNSLIEYFTGEKVVKEKSFIFKYQLSPEKMAKELRDNIKSYAQKHVSKLIDKYIENGQYLTETDLKDLKSTTDKILKENILRYSEKEILENIKKKTRSDDIEEMIKYIESSLMDTIGVLRLNEKCYITCNLLNSILKETNLPREIQEFIQDGKDLVISFNKYNSPWSWKAACIMALGVGQIIAGCLLTAFPILGPFSFHIGSGLISEGCGDITFALNNAANITTTSYFKHKAISMLITCVCVGIGGYLSRASSASIVNGKTIQEQTVRLGNNYVSKEGPFMISKAITKKVMLESGKSVIDYFKGVAVNILSSLTPEFMKQMLRQLFEKIISIIRIDKSYNNLLDNLGSKIEILSDIVKKKSYRQSTKQILDEKLQESIQQHSDQLNNRIENILGQIAGPLSSQIREASTLVQYSGLKAIDNQLGNSSAYFLSTILSSIDQTMKCIKAFNIVFDLICTGRSIAKLTNDKIEKKINSINNTAKRSSNEAKNSLGHESTEQTSEVSESQHTVLIDTRSVNYALNLNNDKEESLEEETEIENQTKTEIENQTKTEIEDQTKTENETKPELVKKESLEIENHIKSVKQSILDTIYKKIEQIILKKAFSKLINFSLESLYKKLDDCLGQDLENLKKRSLAYGEYQTRNKNNPKETGIELELVKDFLINELDSLPLDSPIFETNLEDVQCGHVNIMIKGEMKVLDLSNENHRQFIHENIGAKGIRFFTTQNGITLSRPNFRNYICSITSEKRFTEYDLSVLAQQYNVKIVVKTDNQQETIGSSEGQAEGELYVSLKNGHYEPMVKKGDEYILISDLVSPDNQCGPYAFFYAMKMNDLMNKEQMSFGDADKLIRNDIDMEVDQMVQGMQKYALNSESAWKLFVGREKEGTSIVGGNKRIQNSLLDGQAYFEGQHFTIKQINEDIKQDIKDLVEVFGKNIDQAMQPETRETRKKIENDKIKPIWNKKRITEEELKNEIMIGFVIIQDKDGNREKLIFASGMTPLYNKQKTDSDNKEILKLTTKNGFEFINVGFKYNNSEKKACAAAKAIEYLKETIGLSNVKSFELGEILYQYDKKDQYDETRTQPNTNGIAFAKPCERCQSNFKNEDQNLGKIIPKDEQEPKKKNNQHKTKRHY